MKYLSKALIIYGPTTTGKTSLALQLARKFQGELISADSRQVYKGLDIGSGKVSFESKVEKYSGYWVVDGIKIHGFDLVEPPRYEPGSRKVSSRLEPGSGLERFSVADFLKFAHTTMIQIIGVKKIPIIVGGTGFYIKALLEGVESIGIKPDWKLRRQLEKLSTADLYQKLLKLDPSRTKSLNESDRQNPRRLIRAIEVARAYLTPGVSQVASKHTPGVLPVGNWKILNTKYLLIGLTAPNDYLYNRSDKWLQTRLKRGMIEEVENLINKEIKSQWLVNLGLEYRWITRYLLGRINYGDAIERLRGDIHSFTRRQKTWFRQFKNINLFDISKSDWQKELEKKVKLCYTEG